MKSKHQPQTFNVALLGDTNVGKTSLLITLTTSGFPYDFIPSSYIPEPFPIAIKRYIHLIQFIDTTNDWDEENKPDWYSYGKIDCFVICFSIDNYDSFERIDKYLDEINKYYDKGEIRILLVGTKCEMRSNEQMIRVLKSQGRKMVNKKQIQRRAKEIKANGWMELSSLEIINFKNFYENIENIVMDELCKKKEDLKP